MVEGDEFMAKSDDCPGFETFGADIKAMTAEIQKIGVNINQIARRANATGNIYQEDIEEIRGGAE